MGEGGGSAALSLCCEGGESGGRRVVAFLTLTEGVRV